MEIEEKARTLGWVPQEQFKGDHAKWVDAQEFVERGESIMPILRKNNERLMAEIESTKSEAQSVKAQLAEVRTTLSDFREYHTEATKRAAEEAIAGLEARKLQAMKDGDHEDVIVIDKALRKIEEAPAMTPKPAAPPPPDATVDPIWKAWQSENVSWLGEGDNMKEAQGQAAYLRAMGSSLVGRPFLEAVKAAVEKKVGGGNPVSKVEGGSGQPRAGRQTYSDLPPDAKAACDKFGSKFVGDNKAYKNVDDWRKQYVKDYFS